MRPWLLSKIVIVAALLGSATARADDGAPRVLISADPPAWLVGAFGGSVAVAISDHVALRGEADYVESPIVPDYQIIEGDLDASIYLGRAFHGVFLEPGVLVRHVKEYTPADSFFEPGNPGHFVDTPASTERYVQWGPQVLLGWQWTGSSGLSLAVAAGAAFNLNYDVHRSGREPVVPNGYLRFGYAF